MDHTFILTQIFSFPFSEIQAGLLCPINNDCHNSKQAFIELMQNGDAGRPLDRRLLATDESALFRPTKRTKFNRSIESA